MNGDRLNIEPRHRATLTALFDENLPNVEVWAYGSRVNGKSHRGSDLDLVLRSSGLQKISREDIAKFSEALRESPIPFLVEVHDWAILPELFHRQIERDYVVFIAGDDN
ncbi:MAG: nucleotidyltransferase domain-containing protein [Aestuariivita sp.]|nr:nucleotidyltransferase domain-containing protein [Aestuariivita sp.]MCY4201620.1 nucleotidyltransferase domain-containing protein [Aestuariivita sp.]MCY4289044.1 nucleotidyltransferase domain-containing protein [Aestuariivita sp.]MCY4347229.1 nucleotidyltransferase domain-containing protein [Aestuariivita sp.]